MMSYPHPRRTHSAPRPLHSMIAVTLISLRETLETSLVIGMILTILSRLDQDRGKRFVWMGVGSGIAFSIVVAFLFHLFAASLMHEAKEVYEGVLMLIAAALLTWMILWMMRMGASLRASIQRDITLYALSGQSFAIFLLSFTTTAREGTEMVLFLNAAFLSAESNLHHLAGALAGITGALLLTVLILRGSRKFSLRSFFVGTGVLLLLFAAGLVSHGIGELQEAHIFTLLQTSVWDLREVLPEETLLGGILESLIGYSDHPTVLQVSAYILYLSGAAFCWKRIGLNRKPAQ